MNAIVIAATVMASTGLNYGSIVGKQYVVALTICQGDPLGSPEAGTVDVLSRPRLALIDGQTGFFQVGQTDPISQQFVGLVLRTKLELQPNRKARLQIGYRQRELVSQAENGETIRETTARCCPTMELGRPMTVRLAAESATKQTWAIITVQKHDASKSMTAKNGMRWTVRSLGAGK